MSRALQKLVIEGQNPISGTIKPEGNKNEALPILCTALMNPHPSRIYNVPNIEDIKQLIELLEYLHVKVKIENNFESLVIDTSNIKYNKLPKEMVQNLRGSVTLLGPLLARFGEVFLPKPGGDKIGRRRIDTHLLALKALGAEIHVDDVGYHLKVKKLVGADILLDEASVTATENSIIAAAVAEGRTCIENAASEPHVQGLCRFLVKQGVRIEGIGSNRLFIEGVSTYTNLLPADHRISPDYLEVGCFAAMAALTNGDLFIEDVELKDLRMIDFCFQKLGVHIEYQKNSQTIHVPPNQKLQIQSDVHNQVPKIDDAPWPGLPADVISIMLVLATQCKGNILIHQKLFESRLFFTDSLIAMGAKIILCDPHRALIIGPSELYSAVLSSPDIRAGMALLIAALCAKGTSVIHNIYQIDRGYEKIDERLKLLGANIERV